MVRLQHTVHKILRLVSQGDFDPDLSRVSRLRQMVGNDSFPESLLPEGADETYDETDLEDSDLDDADIEYIQKCEYLDGPPDEGSQRKGLLMHSTSSVVHVLANDGRFLCGRVVGANHCDLPSKVEINSLPFCQQCENAKLDRLAGGRESLQRESVTLPSASCAPTSPEGSLFSLVNTVGNDGCLYSPCSADGCTPDLEDEFRDWERM